MSGVGFPRALLISVPTVRIVCIPTKQTQTLTYDSDLILGPAAQRGPVDSNGFVVGCNSACTVDALNGHAGMCFNYYMCIASEVGFKFLSDDSPNCCSGIHGTQPTCPASGVTNYSYFSQSLLFPYALNIYTNLRSLLQRITVRTPIEG